MKTCTFGLRAETVGLKAGGAFGFVGLEFRAEDFGE